ncbi:MAG: substrate-binding domain-containing protein, partial [Caldilineales bacterium]|nr:substrate-binding domain-containing protein [Caldilineales bacterium]
LQLPQPRPDAVFAASDDLAIGFLAAAAAHGLRPAEDYHLIGFDGQDLAGNTLTTIKVPAMDMGRRAAQLLIERFDDPHKPARRVQLECTLRRGDTARTPSLHSSPSPSSQENPS